MSEGEPFLILGTPDGDKRMDRYNSALFTFLGFTATGEDISSRSHVFIHTEEDGDDMGMYIFACTARFDELRDYMVSAEYPMHLNMRQAPECDENAYQSMIEKTISETDTDDFIPEDW